MEAYFIFESSLREYFNTSPFFQKCKVSYGKYNFWFFLFLSNRLIECESASSEKVFKKYKKIQRFF